MSTSSSDPLSNFLQVVLTILMNPERFGGENGHESLSFFDKIKALFFPETLHKDVPQIYSQYVAEGGNLLELIKQVESGDNYNIANGGDHVPFTNMTINEVLDWQNKNGEKAAGAYQIKPETLEFIAGQMGLTGEEVFTQELQDYFAIALLERRGLNEFLSGELSESDFLANLSKEWRALPEDHRNMSYYGENEYTRVSANQVMDSISNTFNTNTEGPQIAGASTWKPWSPLA